MPDLFAEKLQKFFTRLALPDRQAHFIDGIVVPAIHLEGQAPRRDTWRFDDFVSLGGRFMI